MKTLHLHILCFPGILTEQFEIYVYNSLKQKESRNIKLHFPNGPEQGEEFVKDQNLCGKTWTVISIHVASPLCFLIQVTFKQITFYSHKFTFNMCNKYLLVFQVAFKKISFKRDSYLLNSREKCCMSFSMFLIIVCM